MEARERSIDYYLLPGGRAPFGAWRDGIVDQLTRAAIDARVARLRGGNFSDSRPVGGGVSENRIDFGPGYRIYYGVRGEGIILLCGGDKSTQAADIEKAKVFWKDYKERIRQNAKEPKLQGRPPRRSSK